MAEISYRRHRFPPVIIQHAVWLYLRFTLSYRDVEELLAGRRLDISYETVRCWVLKFGPTIARRLRRCRPRPSNRWHLDEMVVRIAQTEPPLAGTPEPLAPILHLRVDSLLPYDSPRKMRQHAAAGETRSDGVTQYRLGPTRSRRLIPLSQVDQYLGPAGRIRNGAGFDSFREVLIGLRACRWLSCGAAAGAGLSARLCGDCRARRYPSNSSGDGARRARAWFRTRRAGRSADCIGRQTR
jgi:hypothetical protein